MLKYNSIEIVLHVHPCQLLAPEQKKNQESLFSIYLIEICSLTSMNIIDGLPINEIAVDNFRLLPPEYCFTGRSAHKVKPNRCNKQSVI